MKKNSQHERIRYYEALFDEVSRAVNELDKALEGFESIGKKAEELEKYYSGRQWKKDFSDDEKGLLPEDLKRGVLSEDGIYNLLEEVDRLNKAIK